jgi:hypothetical protein
MNADSALLPDFVSLLLALLESISAIPNVATAQNVIDAKVQLRQRLKEGLRSIQKTFWRSEDDSELDIEKLVSFVGDAMRQSAALADLIASAVAAFAVIVFHCYPLLVPNESVSFVRVVKSKTPHVEVDPRREELFNYVHRLKSQLPRPPLDGAHTSPEVLEAFVETLLRNLPAPIPNPFDGADGVEDVLRHVVRAELERLFHKRVMHEKVGGTEWRQWVEGIAQETLRLSHQDPNVKVVVFVDEANTAFIQGCIAEVTLSLIPSNFSGVSQPLYQRQPLAKQHFLRRCHQ